MKIYYAQPECPVCTYLMRAVYLANPHFIGDYFNVKFVEDLEDADEEDLANFKRMFPDGTARLPSILIDNISLYYKGVPPWIELYSFLVRLAYASGGD